MFFFFFSSRRRHTRWPRDWSSDVCSSDLRGLEWALSEARRCIHNNDIEGLRQLLAEYPALLSWRADENEGGLLGMATKSYGDSFDPSREQIFTRAACAELLIDAGDRKSVV